MIVEPIELACLAQVSYLIVDERTKTAAIIDPRRDIEVYLDRARALGARIEHVLLTHFHADFLAGHLELARHTGARLYLGRRARAEYAFTPLGDGDAVVFGDVRIEALETPGHTPESVSYLIFDLARDAAKPHAVMTGDALFVGDVGRPDLLGSLGFGAEELGAALYDSLHEKLLRLPDDTIVYPAHGAGSLCGKSLGAESRTTIGRERRTSYALQPMTKEAFVRLVTAGQVAAPAYFVHDAVQNRKERALLDEVVPRSLRPLSVAEARALVEEGAAVLDVRSAAAFAAGHWAGSTHVGLEGWFASWTGTLLASGRPIVLVAEPGAEREAVTRLGRIGFDTVRGYLAGGGRALDLHPELVRRYARIDASALRERLEGPAPPLVVDVRTAAEVEGGAIEGALHVPLHELAARADELPRDQDLVLVCRSGYRSATAASVLLERGFAPARVCDLVGGMRAWEAAAPQAAAS